MNSRTIVIAIAIIAIAAVGAAAFLYGGQPSQPAPRVVANFEDAGYVRPHSYVIGPVDASQYRNSSLEALLTRQPDWAAHGEPNLELAWQIAGEAGLDVTTARQDALRPGILGVINTDMSDVEKLGVVQTPTFFVNGKAPSGTDPQNLADLVASEVVATQ